MNLLFTRPQLRHLTSSYAAHTLRSTHGNSLFLARHPPAITSLFLTTQTHTPRNSPNVISYSRPQRRPLHHQTIFKYTHTHVPLAQTPWFLLRSLHPSGYLRSLRSNVPLATPTKVLRPLFRRRRWRLVQKTRVR